MALDAEPRAKRKQEDDDDEDDDEDEASQDGNEEGDDDDAPSASQRAPRRVAQKAKPMYAGGRQPGPSLQDCMSTSYHGAGLMCPAL